MALNKIQHEKQMNLDKIMLKLLQDAEKSNGNAKVALFCALDKGSGTTFVINELVSSLAGSRKNVLLLDLNYMDPQLGIHMGARQPFELMNAEQMQPRSEDSVHSNIKISSISGNGLNVALFTDQNFVREFFSQMSAGFDLVLVDLPAMSESYLFLLVASVLKEITIVVQADVTKARSIEKAMRELEDNSVKVKGFIFNQRQDHIPGFIRRKLP